MRQSLPAERRCGKGVCLLLRMRLTPPPAGCGAAKDHLVRVMRAVGAPPSVATGASCATYRPKEGFMAELIAIGYDDETTAAAAAEEVSRLSADLVIEPDAVAVIVRDREGKYHVTTSHHPVGVGASWGMFWGFLFGILFFVPVFGIAVGAGLGALMGKVEKSGIDMEFQRQGRDKVEPGASALFLVLANGTPANAAAA